MTSLKRWRDLPPLTLSNASVTRLISLIPVLVSMTTKGEEPCFDDKTDKPPWWPEDVIWRHPKYFIQERRHNKDECLPLLRKLVHSCYSFHGAEELLCGLDEVPSSDLLEVEGLELIDLADEDSNMVQPAKDAAVFVCCFCLEQFSSHDDVILHQNICANGLKDRFSESPTHQLWEDNESNVTEEADASPFFSSICGPSSQEISASSPVINTSLPLLEKKTLIPDPVDGCPVSSSVAKSTHLVNGSIKVPSEICPAQELSSLKTASSQYQKKPDLGKQQMLVNKEQKNSSSATASGHSFVPTLKTRSQRRLDQIMLRHNMRKKMLKECEDMKAKPVTKAWWVQKKSTPSPLPPHPVTYTSQTDFCASFGLLKAKSLQDKLSEDSDLDLDCQIVLVEGPLSTLPNPRLEERSLPTASPRSRSLMSQLSRNDDSASRRRLSFRFLADEWADREALEEGRDPMQMSLLTIEVSSPLGIRIKKYVDGEGQYNIVKDPESFCKTEDLDDSYGKLRVRANDYRVTFRKRKRASNFVHRYKFNKRDRYMFKILLRTGLTAKSRLLRSQMKKCCVKLKRLAESEIKEWLDGKKIIITEKIVVDDDICITQIDIPESQMKKAIMQKNRLISGYRPGPRSFCMKQQRLSSNFNNISGGNFPFYQTPQIPNIVRNRAGPSPPHRFPYLSSMIRPNLHSHGRGDASTFNGIPKNISAGSSKMTPTQYHLSKHQSLNPSVHSSGGRVPVGGSHIINGRNGNNTAVHSSQGLEGCNNSNRRKQQLTHQVRSDIPDISRLNNCPAPPNPFRPAESISRSPNKKLLIPGRSPHLNNAQTPVAPSRSQQLNNVQTPISSKSTMLAQKLVNNATIRNGRVQETRNSNSAPQSYQDVGKPQHRSRPLPDWGNSGMPQNQNRVQVSQRSQSEINHCLSRTFNASRVSNHKTRPSVPPSGIQSPVKSSFGTLPNNHRQQHVAQNNVNHTTLGQFNHKKNNCGPQPMQKNSAWNAEPLEIICIDDD